MFASWRKLFARPNQAPVSGIAPSLTGGHRRQYGVEPGDENRVDPHPLREQVDTLVLAHKAWIAALRDAGQLTFNIDDCKTVEQATELYTRAWLESALSILATGTGTGAAAYVMQSLGQRGFRVEEITARIKVGVSS